MFAIGSDATEFISKNNSTMYGGKSTFEEMEDRHSEFHNIVILFK